MSSRREQGLERERLGRLAGTGEGSGGGLPLPDLFSAILNDLLDNGPASIERLTGISASTLEYKSNNVMTTWGSWEALTKDALEQIASREIVSRDDDGLWHLADQFTAGVPMVIIPPGKGRKADSVTIWPKDERERLNKAGHAEREVASMVGHVRPVDTGQASAIRASVSEVGQLYPVLKDQYGRILDGAHRLEADPSWPPKVIPVRDDRHALAVSLWANGGKELEDETRARINQLIGDLAGTNEIRRDRITTELRRDASRSNRQIAELVGVGHPLVGEVRHLEESSKSIHRYEFTTAKTGKHSAACWCGEGDAEPRDTASSKQAREQYDDATREAVIQEAKRRLKAGEKTDFRGMAAQFDAGEGFVQRMIAVAKDRLDAEWRQQQEDKAAQQTAVAEGHDEHARPQGERAALPEPEPSLRQLMESPPSPGHDTRLTPEEAAAVAALKQVAAIWPSSLALVSMDEQLSVVRIRDWQEAWPDEVMNTIITDIDGISTYGGKW